MKELIKKELDRLVESQVYGPEGISKKIAELTDLKRMKTAERNALNSEIKFLDKQIEEWKTKISPNQMSMF